MTQAQLNKMSIEDLRRLNEMVCHTINAKKKQLTKENRKLFTVGQKVVVEHKKTSGKVFVISDIRLTKATIAEQGGFAKYDVPLNMLKPYCY